MPEREHDAAAAKAAPENRPVSTPIAGPTALPQAIGNRAMARVVARMEATEAVDALAESLSAGVMGAEQRVVDTMAAFSADTAGFDKVATDYEKKAKAPLLPALARVPQAEAEVPPGWYPGISGGGS